MKVPLLDLQAQYKTIKSEIDLAVADVFESQYFILGPNVKACEEAVAAYARCAHGVGVSSGTDALLIALMAEGIGAGDEVITTPYTFFSTAGSIARTGARPVFADIDPVSYNIDPAQLASRITDKTKAIIPVHLYGRAADMDPTMRLAERHHLVVIEDAAQAIGTEYKGRRAGSIGHYGCFSFFPSKNLGGAGDGGMVVTNEPDRAEKLRMLRNHGAKPKYYNGLIGGNFRLDTLQAAVVRVKLGHLDAWTEARQRNAVRYNELFVATGLPPDPVSLPAVDHEGRHIYNQYVIAVPVRDQLKKFLQEQDIGTEIYYPVPMHLQECFAYLGYQQGDFPASEKAARETLALPVYPEVTDEQARYVVESIARFYNEKGNGSLS